MAAEVIAPFGPSIHAPVVDSSIVEALEELLDRARRGEIAAFAYATVANNETVGNGWRGDGPGIGNLMLGAVSALHARYTQAWLDNCDA